MPHYVALLEPADDGSFGVQFPDLPGCTSVGDDVDDAIRMATEALAGHVAVMRECGDDVPKPRTLFDICADPGGGADIETMMPVLIPLLALPGRTKRINITIDEELLGRIDALTRNRSGFFQEAARALLAGEQARGA